MCEWERCMWPRHCFRYSVNKFRSRNRCFGVASLVSGYRAAMLASFRVLGDFSSASLCYCNLTSLAHLFFSLVFWFSSSYIISVYSIATNKNNVFHLPWQNRFSAYSTRSICRLRSDYLALSSLHPKCRTWISQVEQYSMTDAINTYSVKENVSLFENDKTIKCPFCSNHLMFPLKRVQREKGGRRRWSEGPLHIQTTCSPFPFCIRWSSVYVSSISHVWVFLRVSSALHHSAPSAEYFIIHFLGSAHSQGKKGIRIILHKKTLMIELSVMCSRHRKTYVLAIKSSLFFFICHSASLFDFFRSFLGSASATFRAGRRRYASPASRYLCKWAYFLRRSLFVAFDVKYLFTLSELPFVFYFCPCHVTSRLAARSSAFSISIFPSAHEAKLN